MERTANALTKVDRMRKTLHHQEADRVPGPAYFFGDGIDVDVCHCFALAMGP